MAEVNMFWFRRDLRLEDNCGLYHALREGIPVVPVFIFDRLILDSLEVRKDRRVEFIREALVSIQYELRRLGCSLEIIFGTPMEGFKSLLEKYRVAAVYANEDYEPYAIRRDHQIKELLESRQIPLKLFKDQVIFDKQEVVKDDGSAYTVFTPYSRKWKARLEDFYLKSYPVEKYLGNLYQGPPAEVPSLEFLGFQPTGDRFPAGEVPALIIANYHATRDIPALQGTSRLSVHLRFGTISIRALVRKALVLNETFLNELIWREFYMMILWQFPQVGQQKAFHPAYDRIEWRNNEAEFERWTRGMTGVPIVDAGMRQLNETGYMHNRLRMITASYLVKNLLIDWRWGESYFAEKLLDFDLAANNGGWQWAAGSGCDSVPYFRIFNPELQTKKFDPNFEFISRWVPEFREPGYPSPMVVHSEARNRCLAVYKKALSEH